MIRCDLMPINPLKSLKIFDMFFSCITWLKHQHFRNVQILNVYPLWCMGKYAENFETLLLDSWHVAYHIKWFGFFRLEVAFCHSKWKYVIPHISESSLGRLSVSLCTCAYTYTYTNTRIGSHMHASHSTCLRTNALTLRHTLLLYNSDCHCFSLSIHLIYVYI